MDSLKRPKHRKMDRSFGQGMHCLYMAGSLRTVARELIIYKSDLVGAQEVKLDRSGTEPASIL
jgi:hypothetical protein